MSTKATELRIERQRLVAQMGEQLRKGTPEGLAEWHKLDAHQQDLKNRIDAVESASVSRPNIGDAITRHRDPKAEQIRSVQESREYGQAFERWARFGDNAPEVRALGEGVALGGETLV
jgi:hypothetical protein